MALRPSLHSKCFLHITIGLTDPVLLVSKANLEMMNPMNVIMVAMR